MTKKLFFVVFGCAVLLLGIRAHFTYAQKEQPSPGNEQGIARIESKLDDLLKTAKENKEIGRKLERVLSNQEKILSELEIIKVRATR